MMDIWKVVQKVGNVWKVENDNNNKDKNEIAMMGKEKQSF